VKAVELVARSIDLYLYGIAIGSASYLLSYLFRSKYPVIVSAVSLLFAIFIFTYNMVLPKLLELRQKGKRLGLAEIRAVVIANLKRLVLPGLTILLLGFPLVLLSLWVRMNTSIFSRVFFLFITTSLCYTGIFFSIEGRSLFKSMIASILYNLRHVKTFVCILLVYGLISLVIGGTSIFKPSSLWIELSRAVVLWTQGMFVGTYLLIYYQEQN